MVYVLKGWFKSEFDGEGVHTFHAGSCWIQPPKIKHTVRGYSDDCELLEIVLPANFETVTLKK
jgi:quercetin dioxygenase-like cupin family protein